MKIGIFGGTFNPIHNGHLTVAQYAMEQCGLDRVYFMTSSIPPHKENKAVSADIRHRLVCEAIKDYDGFYPLDFEIKKGGISYTADTLKELKGIFKEDELYFIIGGDSLRDFDKWRRPEEIVRYCTLIVYPRTGIDINEKAGILRNKLGARIKTIDSPEMEISSTEIRKRIGDNKNVSFFIPEKVMDIIKKEKIYV